jgi:hypothetical protein
VIALPLPVSAGSVYNVTFNESVSSPAVTWNLPTSGPNQIDVLLNICNSGGNQATCQLQLYDYSGTFHGLYFTDYVAPGTNVATDFLRSDANTTSNIFLRFDVYDASAGRECPDQFISSCVDRPASKMFTAYTLTSDHNVSVDLIFGSAAAAPEPSGLLVMAGGAMILGILRRARPERS